MKISDNGLKLIEFFEGLRLKPYLCSAKVPTIGIGTTIYPNGKKVSIKDAPITKEQAYEYLRHDISKFEKDLNILLGKTIVNQNQFDALLSFGYNVGMDVDSDTKAEGLGDSTLFKKVKINPNDLTIRQEFLKWNKAGGVVVNGLTIRRNKEADLYFKK